MQGKPPFIASQQILLLDAALADPRRLLSPDVFRQTRFHKAGGEAKEPDDQSPWRPVSREALFLDGGPPRLCLTTDAGIGKTTTMLWAEQQIARAHPDRLAIYVQLRDLPAQADQYTATLAELVLIRSGQDLDRATVQQIVENLLQAGRLVLLVDALDQTLSDTSADAKLRVLARFLQLEARNCSVAVAGRPYAIDRYWDTLFAEETWQFAQLTAFNSDQQRAYLGRERLEHLERLNVEVLSIPRALETIRVVPLEELGELRTAADIYWRAVEVMLTQGFKSHLVRRADPTAEFTIEDARRLLAMLAFEMTRDDNFSGVAEQDMDEFLEAVWRRQQPHSPWGSLERLKGRLRLLGILNDFLEHAVLDARELVQLYWKNRSLQEFFAGLWLARYAPEEDRDWIAESIYQPVYEQGRWGEDQRGSTYWMWRFAAEMPEEGRRWKCWLHSLTPLLRPGDGTAEGTLRSSEMIYRSWPTMQAYASGQDKAAEIAVAAITAYQSEFNELVHSGRRGEQAQQIAKDFLAGFQPIPPATDARNALRFRMGSLETEQDRDDDEAPYDAKLDDAFELHRYAVTNEIYDCFDPSHAQHRDHRSPDDRSPVIYVSWYDAWAFCRWLGPEFRMPTEKEWEFACRAGTTTPFHCGDSLSSEKANFDGNYPYGKASKGPYLEHTAPVGSYQPNAWGLYDMHGNVWEWCDSWFSDTPEQSDQPDFIGSARVLRGGSWFNDGDYCRSACRFYGLPSNSDVNFGFRVARA